MGSQEAMGSQRGKSHVPCQSLENILRKDPGVHEFPLNILCVLTYNLPLGKKKKNLATSWGWRWIPHYFRGHLDLYLPVEQSCFILSMSKWFPKTPHCECLFGEGVFYKMVVGIMAMDLSESWFYKRLRTWGNGHLRWQLWKEPLNLSVVGGPLGMLMDDL